MSETRYTSVFARLKKNGEGALIPFFMMGYPNVDQFFDIIDAAVAAGVDALELGIPYSDPVADGPVIVEAANTARLNGVTVAQSFQLIAALRQKYPDLPIGLLVYANLVLGQNHHAFFSQCQSSGVDSLLVADVPLREREPLMQACAQHGVATVFILPPDASTATAQLVAENAQAYVYLLSRAGVTGADKAAALPVQHLLQQLRDYRAAPAIAGFGIGTAKQVRAQLDAGAVGVIVGSALVNVINKHSASPAHAVQTYLTELKAACRV